MAGIFPGTPQVVKSMQRGSFQSVFGTVDVTISSVNTSKALVIVNARAHSSSADQPGVVARLTTATNLQVEVGYSAAGNCVIDWQVMEIA